MTSICSCQAWGVQTRNFVSLIFFRENKIFKFRFVSILLDTISIRYRFISVFFLQVLFRTVPPFSFIFAHNFAVKILYCSKFGTIWLSNLVLLHTVSARVIFSKSYFVPFRLDAEKFGLEHDYFQFHKNRPINSAGSLVMVAVIALLNDLSNSLRRMRRNISILAGSQR